MEKLDANAMYISAEQFRKTANLLSQQINRGDPNMITPLVVNGSFCLELYFKCLLVLENTDFKQEHDLKKLYNKLSSESEDVINSDYNKRIKGNPMLQMLKHDFPNLDMSIEKRIIDFRNAFTIWRYSYEKTEKDYPKFNVIGLSEIIDATRARIISLQQ